MYSLDQWQKLESQTVAEIVSVKASTAAIYLNGTRRWFLSQSEDWSQYSQVTGQAHRQLNDLFYQHGLRTLFQPVIGYDLMERGSEYMAMAIEQGLGELTTPDYCSWFHETQTRVTFYGNWHNTLSEGGFDGVLEALNSVVQQTASYDKHQLLFGVFADEGLDRIVRLSKAVTTGQSLLTEYYGQPVGPIDLVVGAGQPAIWDLPLLDINKASLYFLQAPTFCLHQAKLREMLYDYLFQRVNDDMLYDNLSDQIWQSPRMLGLGQQTNGGWIAL